MPGYLNRQQLDPSKWTKTDWLAARRWNGVFLVAWITAFSVIVLLQLRGSHPWQAWITIAIAVTGILIQSYNLRGIDRTIVNVRDDS